MPQSRAIFGPDTAAGTPQFFVPSLRIKIPVIVVGLTGTEKATIQIPADSEAGTWTDYIVNGATPVFSVNINKISFDEPGRYRINKPITAQPVKIFIDAH